MASATSQETKKIDITLSLTLEEAAVLKMVLNQVGGYSESTPRGMADDIVRALGNCPQLKYIQAANFITGTLFFKENTLEKFRKVVYERN
jgi:hypothetical protein